MGDKKQGLEGAGDKVLHPENGFYIQMVGRLVQEKDIRLGNHGPGKKGTPFHPGGKISEFILQRKLSAGQTVSTCLTWVHNPRNPRRWVVIRWGGGSRSLFITLGLEAPAIIGQGLPLRTQDLRPPRRRSIPQIPGNLWDK